MDVLVMGGTQFNGLSLVWELARHGHNVTILNRGKTQAEIPVGVQRLVADRSDEATVRAAMSRTAVQSCSAAAASASSNRRFIPRWIRSLTMLP